MNIQLEGNQFQGVLLPFDPTEPNVAQRWQLLDKIDPAKEMGQLVQYTNGIHVFRGQKHGINLSFTIQPNNVYIPQP